MRHLILTYCHEKLSSLQCEFRHLVGLFSTGISVTVIWITQIFLCKTYDWLSHVSPNLKTVGEILLTNKKMPKKHPWEAHPHMLVICEAKDTEWQGHEGKHWEGSWKMGMFIALIIERSNRNHSCYSRLSFQICFTSVLRELSDLSSADWGVLSHSLVFPSFSELSTGRGIGILWLKKDHRQSCPNLVPVKTCVLNV